jgi:hypothetical protein
VKDDWRIKQNPEQTSPPSVVIGKKKYCFTACMIVNFGHRTMEHTAVELSTGKSDQFVPFDLNFKIFPGVSLQILQL